MTSNREDKQFNRQSHSPMYALPRATEVGAAEDWTSISDPKARKRVQNRVAQRLYRQRMKARVAELERKVDQSEGKTQDAVPDGPLFSPSEDAHVSVSSAGYAGTYFLPDPFNFLSFSGDMNHDDDARADAASQALLRQEVEKSIYVNTGGTNGSQCDFNSEASTLSGDSISVDGSVIDAGRKGGGSMHQSEMAASVASTPNETFPRRSRPRSRQPESPNSSTNQEAFLRPSPNIGRHSIDQRESVDNTLGRDGERRPPNSPDCTEKSFEKILSSVRSAGFDSLEAALLSYYSRAFTESSEMAYQQWVSRNTRLPNLVSSLFKSATDWGDWERQELYKKLHKTVVDSLVSEDSVAWNTILDRLGTVSTARSPATAQEAERAEGMLKILLPRELPNLWALLSALTGYRSPRSNDECPEIITTIALLLHSANRIPRETALAMLSECLPFCDGKR